MNKVLFSDGLFRANFSNRYSFLAFINRLKIDINQLSPFNKINYWIFFLKICHVNQVLLKEKRFAKLNREPPSRPNLSLVKIYARTESYPTLFEFVSCQDFFLQSHLWHSSLDSGTGSRLWDWQLCSAYQNPVKRKVATSHLTCN